MRQIIRALPVRRSIAVAAVMAAVSLLPMLAAPAAPPAAAPGTGCQYAFPRVRAWQLAQAELADGRAGEDAAALFGIAGPPC